MNADWDAGEPLPGADPAAAGDPRRDAFGDDPARLRLTGRHLQRVPPGPDQSPEPAFRVSPGGSVYATDALARETAETVLYAVQLAEAAGRTLGAGPTTAVELLGAQVITATVHHGPEGVSVVGHVEDVEAEGVSSRHSRQLDPAARRPQAASALDLVRDVPGVLGWFLLSGTGRILVRAVPADVDDGVLTELGRRCDAGLQAGGLPMPTCDQVILRYERLAVFALRAGGNLLVVLGEPATRTVLARTAMRVAAPSAAAVTGPEAPTEARPAPRTERPSRSSGIWG